MSHRPMDTRRPGLTLIELLFVLMIGALLTSVGAAETSRLTDMHAVRNARDAVLLTPHRARSEAIRQGQPVFLWLDPGPGTVTIGTSSDTLHTLEMSDYNVTMTGSALTLCYTSRGYAMPGCSTVSSTEDISFSRNGRSVGLTVMPLGQMWRDS